MSGLRLHEPAPGALLGPLGLRRGDRLERINDHDLTTPAAALEAYAELPGASSLRLDLTRDGQPTTIEVEIE